MFARWSLRRYAIRYSQGFNNADLSIIQSAFSVRLAPFGFNHYSMFVPDILHEFELGVWKATLTHLLRILHAEGRDRIQIFNSRFVLMLSIFVLNVHSMLRFRRVPTFGRDTIRQFDTNVSAMKRLAARDYEDILQVCRTQTPSFTLYANCSKVLHTGLRLSPTT